MVVWKYDHLGVLHWWVRRINHHWPDRRRDSLKKYSCRIAAVTHIVYVITISDEIK